jgi:hypothetical protein
VAEVGGRPTPGTATSFPRGSACTIQGAWASERTSLSVPQTIGVGQETRPSVRPQSGPAARVTLSLAGVEAWAPAADLPPFPDRLRGGAGAVELGGLEILH